MSWIEFAGLCALALVCSTLAVMAEDDDQHMQDALRNHPDWCYVNPGFTPETPGYGVTRFANRYDAIEACAHKVVWDETPTMQDETIVFD